MGRERNQYRQEGNQRHNRVDKADAHIFQRRSKTHGVFLHTLRCAFDVTQMLPVRHIVFVHRGTPAEHIVADKEVVHHANDYGYQRNTEKNAHFMIELLNLHLVWCAERSLNQVIKWRIPGVDGDADFNQKPGHKNNQRCAQNRPVLPAVWAVEKPEQREHPDTKNVVRIKNQVIQRPETRCANRYVSRRAGNMCNPGSPTCLPEYNGDECPNKCRNKERPRLWEKRLKHSALLLTSYRYDDCCAFATVECGGQTAYAQKHKLKPTIVTKTEALSSHLGYEELFLWFSHSTTFQYVQIITA